MRLTKELLEIYGASAKGLEWFDRNYPDGASCLDIIKNKATPNDYLFWGLLHLTTTRQERAAYYKRLNINDSTNIWACEDVDHSDMVVESKHVKNSKYIYFCENVENSEDVSYSEDVTEGKELYSCMGVTKSFKAIFSNHITGSRLVATSNFIIDSANIFSSMLITRSHLIFDCQNVEDSLFSVSCKDSDHCLFCFERTGAHYEIFNHSVSKTQWDFLYSESFSQLSPHDLLLYDKWDPENVDHGLVDYHTRNRLLEPVLNDQLIRWIKHLPFYDGQLAYQMTFHPSFLD